MDARVQFEGFLRKYKPSVAAEAVILDEPAVQTLIAEALVRAKVCISAKQRGRRPSAAKAKKKP